MCVLVRLCPYEYVKVSVQDVCILIYAYIHNTYIAYGKGIHYLETVCIRISITLNYVYIYEIMKIFCILIWVDIISYVGN